MATFVFDDPTDLPAAGAEARLEITLTGTGTAFIATDVVAGANLDGIKSVGTHALSVMLATGSTVQGTSAIHLIGAASGVHNEGAITGTATGIRLAGGGASSVTNLGTITATAGIGIEISASALPADKLTVLNSGTITASGLVVKGGFGDDRIVNSGTMATTATGPGAVLMDLGDGKDVYDGSLGAVPAGIIKLGAGDDKAYGGIGSETFSGGTGHNVIDGGLGNDWVDYSDVALALSINLGLSGSQATHAQSSDTLISIESIIGTALNDTLTGSVADNTLQGGAGNDALNGGTGADSLEGGTGDDTLEGGIGNDTLDGGTGTDKNNTARYTGSLAATVDLTKSGMQQNTVNHGMDTLTGISHLEGGSGADTFTGNDDDNKLVGNSGNDTLTGGKGNDILEGGAGQDMAVFAGSKDQYVRTSTADGFTIADTVAGRDGTDTLKDVRLVKFLGSNETIALTNATPTNIFLNSSSVLENTVAGTSVATLSGTDSDSDGLSYALVSDAGGLFSIGGTSLILNAPLDHETATQHTIAVKVTDTYGAEFVKPFTISVRNVSETTPSIRYGTNTNVTMEQVVGEAGADQLFGLGGSDQLFGLAGNDVLRGGAGNDRLSGGSGQDVFVFDVKPNVKSNLEFIDDFTVVDDTIHLAKKIFTKIAKKGALSKDAFVVGDRFRDKEDRILYHKKGGALFYDPDGVGRAKAVQFATIDKGLAITAKDFWVI